MKIFDDAKLPTEAEQRHLARLMSLAFCELRLLSHKHQNEQAHDLADAFHNVPLHMYRDDFSFQFFRSLLNDYQIKYKDRMAINYLAELDKLATNHVTS